MYVIPSYSSNESASIIYFHNSVPSHTSTTRFPRTVPIFMFTFLSKFLIFFSGAGVPEGDSVTSRTFHYPFTYAFLNLGLGSNVTNLNISLNATPINETGNGILCIEKFPLPANLGITKGLSASLQISTIGPTGTAQYNVSSYFLVFV